MHTFNGVVEHAIAHIEEAVVHEMPEEQQRWYAIKVFERDDKVMAKLNLSDEIKSMLKLTLKMPKKSLTMTAKALLQTKDIFT